MIAASWSSSGVDGRFRFLVRDDDNVDDEWRARRSRAAAMEEIWSDDDDNFSLMLNLVP